MCVHAQSCPTLCDPWTVARQPPLSMEFPRKDTGVGCHFLLQGIFPTQGWNSGLLHVLHWRQTLYHGATSPLTGFLTVLHTLQFTRLIYLSHCLSPDESKPSQGKRKIKGALMLLSYLQHPLAQSRFSINTC